MTPIRFAVATAIASAAVTTANALPISSYDPTTAVNVYISGSTAVDNTLLNTEIALGAPGGLCQANTIDVYQIGSPSQRLTFCSAAAITGVTAGTPLAIFKESSAGSINGVQPLININKGVASGVTFISPSLLIGAGGDADCAAATLTQQNPATAYSAYTMHASCAGSITAAATVITGGVADVEAGILRDLSGTPVNATDITRLTGAPGLDVVWGVPVTKNLYRALQTAEGLTAKCPGTTGTFLDSPSCAPSLSAEQVASLYTATGLVTWNQIAGVTNPVTGGDNNVYICRRDVGSGTEASFEAYFLGARCSSSDEVMAAEDGQYVFASGSTGNVRSCMQAFFSGGTITPYNTALPAVTEPGNQMAIGILSSEVSAGNLSGANDSFRMVAVDGVLPTLANTSNGFWRYFSTDVFYKIKSGAGAPAGAALAEFNALQSRIGHPAFTALTNAAFAGRPWGNGGDLAPAALFGPGTSPATSANMATNPVNSFAKVTGAVLNAPVNNCNTPVLLNNGGTDTTPAQSNLLGSGNINN